MSKKILILTGGPVKKLDLFKGEAQNLNLDVLCASFYDMSYRLGRGTNYKLEVQGRDVAELDLIYIRVIGKRLEEASLVINYACEKGIRIVDRIYQGAGLTMVSRKPQARLGDELNPEPTFSFRGKSRQLLLTENVIPSTILKTLEMKMLYDAGVPIPETYHARLSEIIDKGEKYLRFPFVIKASVGQKARAVWAPKERKDLPELYIKLRELEKQGSTFFAQSMINSTKRARIFVIGEKVVGGIIRSTKYRKRFQKAEGGSFPEPVKESLKVVPKEMSDLALKAAKAVKLEIAGIDILIEEDSGELYVIEANAAPSWNLITKDLGINVEREILKYLANI